jgi:hypothetical protein
MIINCQEEVGEKCGLSKVFSSCEEMGSTDFMGEFPGEAQCHGLPVPEVKSTFPARLVVCPTLTLCEKARQWHCGPIVSPAPNENPQVMTKASCSKNMLNRLPPSLNGLQSISILNSAYSLFLLAPQRFVLCSLIRDRSLYGSWEGRRMILHLQGSSGVGIPPSDRVRRCFTPEHSTRSEGQRRALKSL